MRYILTILKYSLLALLPALGGCVDDTFADFNGEFPKGNTFVSIEAGFSPFSSADMKASRSAAPSGTIMNEISDVCLLAYDKEGNLMPDFPMEITGYEISSKGRTDADASNNIAAEKKTASLTKKGVSLPYGQYYLIMVANLGTYTADEKGNITVNKTTFQALENKYSGQYSTLADLRKMAVDWDNSDFYNNREMLGYFTNPDEIETPRASSDFKMVSIRKPNMELHAWLRRVASKVTVDFDGSALRENVFVYIRRVTVRNRAANSTLGFGRELVNNGNDVVDYNNTAGSESIIAESSDEITFGEGADYESWPLIAKGSPYLTQKGADGSSARLDVHKEDAPALFFYENMQGDAPNGKIQKADYIDGDAEAGEVCDGLPYGTYIDVEGYYISNSTGNISRGPIHYRFMLGKDEVKDCNVERNYHYQVTLKLRGNANEFDWHVDYIEEEGFEAPNPWYVSYLYNHTATLPFKYTPPEGYEVVKMTARITKNPWWADSPEIAGLDPNDPDDMAKIKSLDQSFVPPGSDPTAYGNDKNQKWLGNGFLALRNTTRIAVTQADCNFTFDGYGDKLPNNVNDKYFYGETAEDGHEKIDYSTRTYYFDGTVDDTNKGVEAYSVQTNGDKQTFNIPLFTREKILYKQTGYTGNNPFVGYSRTAHVELEATIRRKDTHGDEKTVTHIVPVRQVRRIENPKGVYRRSGNFEPFNVELMELGGDLKDNFISFDSDGPWLAEVVGDDNFITLDGKSIVTGATKTPIKFQIRFNQLNTDNKVRNAIVRVRYHNYTCIHLIFVRQGYAPIQLTDKAQNGMGGTKQPATPTYWRTFNMISKNVEATDPRDEGSLFRFGNADFAIDAVNNIYKNLNGDISCRFPIYEEENGSLNDLFVAQGPFEIADPDDGSLMKNKIAWKNEVDGKVTNPKSDDGFTQGKLTHVAGMHDFEQLYLSDNIQSGYGILYADGARFTQSMVNDAYGYYRRDPECGKKGMRGVFLYYYDPDHEKDATCTARNIFFPIGRSGFGHRKEGNEGSNDGKGMLRYCANGYERRPIFAPNAPFFSSLYYRPGAIYYAKAQAEGDSYLLWDGTTSGDVAFGLDLNYFTYDINAITLNSMGQGVDAAFLRCVGDW